MRLDAYAFVGELESANETRRSSQSESENVQVWQTESSGSTISTSEAEESACSNLEGWVVGWIIKDNRAGELFAIMASG